MEEGGGENDEEKAYRENLTDTTVSDASFLGSSVGMRRS